MDSQVCQICQKSAANLKKCGRCQSVYYCSVDCQKKDWSTHKEKCGFLTDAQNFLKEQAVQRFQNWISPLFTQAGLYNEVLSRLTDDQPGFFGEIVDLKSITTKSLKSVLLDQNFYRLATVSELVEYTRLAADPTKRLKANEISPLILTKIVLPDQLVIWHRFQLLPDIPTVEQLAAMVETDPHVYGSPSFQKLLKSDQKKLDKQVQKRMEQTTSVLISSS